MRSVRLLGTISRKTHYPNPHCHENGALWFLCEHRTDSSARLAPFAFTGAKRYQAISGLLSFLSPSVGDNISKLVCPVHFRPEKSLQPCIAICLSTYRMIVCQLRFKAMQHGRLLTQSYLNFMAEFPRLSTKSVEMPLIDISEKQHLFIVLQQPLIYFLI